MTTGLMTDGEEFMTLDNVEYVGPYHTYGDGAVYTGSDYTSDSQPLIKYRLNEPEVSLVYDKITENKFPKKAELVASEPVLTEDDYTIGHMSRYFAVKINDNTGYSAIEISKKDYNKFKVKKSSTSFIYNVIEIKWKLTGPLHDEYDGDIRINSGVFDTNRRVVVTASKKQGFLCLINVIQDYLKYTIYDDDIR